MEKQLQNIIHVPWKILLSNGGSQKWLIKFACDSESYKLAVTDTVIVFLECLDKNTIQNRFKKLNKRLESPVERIIEHLQQSIEKHDINHFKSSCLDGKSCCLTLFNDFYQGIPFHWEFKCAVQVIKSSSVTKQLLCDPLVIASARLMLENKKLIDLLKLKDREITDYKENGSKVSRQYLETPAFDSEKFYQDLKHSVDYAKAVTQDPLLVLSSPTFNEVMTTSVMDSHSEDVQQCLSCSTVTTKGNSSNAQSPSKLRLKRKVKPEHRGAHFIAEDNEEDSASNNHTKKELYEPKPKLKKQKKDIFKKSLF